MIEMSITNIIVGLTVVVSLLALNNPSLMSKMLLNPYQVIQRKEYYRIFTHAFIHGNFLHLFFNMYVLYSFGNLIETIFTNQEVFNRLFPSMDFWGVSKGYLIYILVYFGGLMFAVLPSLKKHQNNPSYNSLGASGAVSAVVMVFILVMPTSNLQILFIPFNIPAFILGAAYLIYEYVMSKKGNTGIAHDAHLLGAVFGLVLILVVQPSMGLHFLNEIAYFFGLIN